MEGPSVRAIADHLKVFEGKTVSAATGTARIEKERLRGEHIEAVFSSGKQLVIRFPERAVMIHFLMFGSYRINEVREGMQPRLALEVHGGSLTLRLYNCVIRLVSAAQLDELVKDEFDILSDNWSLNRVLQRSAELKEAYICDILLDQNVFAGVGNIIKNEALFRAAVQPLSVVDKIPGLRVESIALEARAFSQRFYEVRRASEKLNPSLQIYRKKHCPRWGQQVQLKRTGKSARISFFCPGCQVLYA
jgi:endonuclease-8